MRVLPQAKLNSIYSIMKNEWYFGKEDENLEQDLIDAALYGMSSSSLDPHTTYMSAEETLAFSTSIDNNFVGIGIQYYSGTGLKVVTRVFVDSPPMRRDCRLVIFLSRRTAPLWRI